MSQIACRCYHCHRVHTLDSGTQGYVLTCTCGKMFRVPRTNVGPDAAPESMPFGEVHEAEAIAPRAAAKTAAAEEAGLEHEKTELLDIELDTPVLESMPRPPRVAAAATAAAAATPKPAGPKAAAPKAQAASAAPAAAVVVAPAPRASSRSAKLFYFLAVLAFLAFLAHTSPWTRLDSTNPLLERPLPDVLHWTKPGQSTHYFNLESSFWSAILGALTIALAGEGYLRSRAARVRVVPAGPRSPSA